MGAVTPSGYLRLGIAWRQAHEHGGAQACQRLGLCRRLGPLRFAFHQQQAAAAVLDDVGDLVGRAAPVDAGRHGAHHHGRQVHGGPFGAVEAQDAHRVAGLHAQRHQRAGGLAHLLGVFLPGGGLPALRVAHEIGGRLRLALAGGHEAGRDALEALVACGQRPAVR
jgi:hypothetical protein